jgi:hypothetical protein
VERGQRLRSFFVPRAEVGAAATPLERWRADSLRRYKPDRWKHTMLELVPRMTFRPSEISTDRRDELARRHPDHNNPSVGTHNALADLIADGVLVKLETGRYAAAAGWIVLPLYFPGPGKGALPRFVWAEAVRRA